MLWLKGRQNSSDLPRCPRFGPVTLVQEVLRGGVHTGSFLFVAQPVCQACATAKINNPDGWNIRASFRQNVSHLDVPVEHTSGVGLNESIHLLLWYDLCIMLLQTGTS